MKRRLSRDSGYTLVEMIIVIAVIAILAIMSLVSITIINSARVKSACVRTGSEINAIKLINRSMKPSGSDTAYALALYTDSNGVVNCCKALRNDATPAEYTLDTTDNVTFSSSVEVRFTGTRRKVDDEVFEDVTDELITAFDDKPLIIAFDKRGNCFSGYGDIKFFKKSGSQVARIHITSTGSIDVR